MLRGREEDQEHSAATTGTQQVHLAWQSRRAAHSQRQQVKAGSGSRGAGRHCELPAVDATNSCLQCCNALVTCKVTRIKLCPLLQATCQSNLHTIETHAQLHEQQLQEEPSGFEGELLQRFQYAWLGAYRVVTCLLVVTTS
jgi:hypothetical protein